MSNDGYIKFAQAIFDAQNNPLGDEWWRQFQLRT
jgi:hypothetical protein